MPTAAEIEARRAAKRIATVYGLSVAASIVLRILIESIVADKGRDISAKIIEKYALRPGRVNLFKQRLAADNEGPEIGPLALLHLLMDLRSLPRLPEGDDIEDQRAAERINMIIDKH